MTAFFAALWLGILTSISPCPLATNIAAVSYLSKRINSPKLVIWSGLSYALGRMAAYALLGALIIFSIVAIPQAANFLQKYMNRLLGFALIIAGLFLLDLLKLPFKKLTIPKSSQENLASRGLGGSFLIGFVFALSFCPISAAFYFGSLIPLSLSHESGILLPLLYGVGTALPVVLFTAGISIGVNSVTRWLQRLSMIEPFMRKSTGAIFVLVGVYYIWAYWIIL